MAIFYICIYHDLHIWSGPSNFFNEFNYLKSLAFSQRYKPSITKKALNILEKPKHFVYHSNCCLNSVLLPFNYTICSKICKIFSQFGFKVSFKLVNKIKFSFLEDSILNENQCTIYFIPYTFSNLGYAGQTSRQLKTKVDEHYLKIKIEEIYSS